uniref:3-oxoacyl-acyl-carrier-protein synthase 3 n=1 Tax=Porphyridium aerugineum TaxID=2792 RepID=UPI001FCD45BF|nr:3-oxoacyl-acyl-carrier-protein synthase 3 [Porphyridium aerugineum]UNJ17850.1 3-oxoacyl-acyl-carrier-protein synthase 3 [Porphyridium aerugineum]
MNLLDTQGVAIIGTGSCVPSMCITNNDLSKIVDTSDDWITSRTGIKQRRIKSADESILSLASEAGLRAIKNAKLESKDIDLIILATSTPEDLFGSASKIQALLDARNSLAFDLTAACSGFLLAFVTAAQFLATHKYKNALIIGADILSDWVDWTDRKTCVLFGDGAAAVVLQASNNNSLIDFKILTDGNQSKYLNISSNTEKIQSNHFFDSKKRSYNFITMDGKEVYKFAVSKIPTLIKECLENNQLTVEDIDWLLLHQANERILKAIADKLGISHDKILQNLNNYGNTSAASIPLMLDEAINLNKIKKNDLIIMSGFGAGLTWGVALIRWI